MLIMWRRCGESLVVSDNVEIEVLEVRQRRVRLGIVAPESVPVVRTETLVTRDANVAAAWSVDSCMLSGLVKTLLR